LRGQPQCEACPRSPADRTWVHAIKIELMTQLRHCAGLLSRVLRLGPRRLFARPGCPVVDRDTRGTQPGQQYSSHRGRIESNILGVWWMCFAALQSERQVQLLAKVLNDEIDLIVSHDLLFLLLFCPATILLPNSVAHMKIGRYAIGPPQGSTPRDCPWAGSKIVRLSGQTGSD
jgi:hypothetical protein